MDNALLAADATAQGEREARSGLCGPKARAYERIQPNSLLYIVKNSMLMAVCNFQCFSPLYVTKSVIDSGAIRGIICLLFLVKNRKEAEDGRFSIFQLTKPSI
jgi:hypothetical protein